MWIVRLALRRPYTFVVVAMLIAVLGAVNIERMAVLDSRRRVQYRTLKLGRDFGAEIAVIAGLNDGETIVVHPGDDLPKGTVAEPIPLPK
jgi:hypothetical protein